MGSQRNFQAEMRALLRDRLLDATVEIICADGWGAVTMSRIAERVGISRQGLYNEIGTKQALGEAIVARETDRFLDGIRAQLAAHPADPVAGLTAAVDHTLRSAADDPLIKAIVAGEHATDSELLPLLASRPEPVLQRAVDAIAATLRRLYPNLGVPDGRFDELVEVTVRLTLSHLIQPSGSTDRAVAQIRRIIELALNAGTRPGAR